MESIDRIAQPVLVTGASGFIGRRVVARLLEAGVAVRALVLPHEQLPEEWGTKVDIVRGDIADPEAVRQAVAGAGTIIHLAAVVSDWGDEALYWKYTVDGSRLVFEEALRNNSRVVLTASVVVYGDNVRKRPCPEETPYGRAFGPYSRTKQAQERLAWEYYRDKALRLTVVRPANVYGPGSGPWLHDIIDVLKSGAPGLISGGKGNAGLAYVDNVADVLILAGLDEETVGRVYNAGDGLDVTWNQYFHDLAAMIGAKKPASVPRPLAAASAVVFESLWKLFRVKKRPPLTREALNLVGSDNRFPNGRTARELGYTPLVSYAEGMARTKTYLEQYLKK
ncbi:MAG: NAD-dependent epimerase/dehydratase family protein [Thermodesulfobacteriota bacterium]